MKNAERFRRDPRRAHIALFCSRRGGGEMCDRCEIGRSECYEKCFVVWCALECASDGEILAFFKWDPGIRQMLENEGDVQDPEPEVVPGARNSDLSDRLADALGVASLLAGVIRERDEELLFVIDRMRAQMDDTRNMLDWFRGSIRQRGSDYDFVTKLCLDKITGVKK